MFLQEYEKIRQLGKGAFATVYKVRHSKLGYIRALKVCNNFIEDEDDRAWQTFVSECKILLNIGNGSHPNIVRIYQPRLLDNRAVVEMDCVEGESLHDYISDNRFIDINEFFRFAEQIVGAVAYCHVDVYKFLMDPAIDNLELDPKDGRKYLVSPEKEKELIRKYGVVHNDLHSGNIIRRDYDGQYVLLDFGLAIQDSHCVKSSSRFDGAIEYCSPEKLERGTVSTKSDVYALGILLYEMLAGRVPFPYEVQDGQSPESARSRVYMQHLKEVPPPIFELRKQAFESTHPGETYTRDYPEELEAMIMKCLAKNPDDRYANAKEMKLDLKKVSGGIAVAEPKHNNSDNTVRIRPDKNDDDIKTQVLDVAANNTTQSNDEPKERKKRSHRGLIIALIITAVIAGAGVAAFLYLDKKSSTTKDSEDEENDTNTEQTEVSEQTDNTEYDIPVPEPYDEEEPGYTEDPVEQVTPTEVEEPEAIAPTETTKPDKKTEPKKPAETVDTKQRPANTQVSNTTSLGYGTWTGETKNGKPHGKGKIVFTSTHQVDKRSSYKANPGDYFIATYDNGQLISGKLYDKSGNLLKTIIP